MAETTQNFRLAFHGFNRDDVVSFLEGTMSRHSQEVNELKEKIQRLEAQLSVAQAAVKVDIEKEQENQTLKDENGKLKESLEALKAENKQLKETTESLEAQLTAPEHEGPQEADWETEELAAYRRAESVERQAKTRATQLYNRINGVVADLAARMDGSHQNMTEAADAMGKALDSLQAALDLAQATLHDGAGSLRSLRLEE